MVEPNTSDSDERLDAFQTRIGYRFESVELLHRALTHRSYANEARGKLRDNQRLEFLGDALLGAIISEELFRRYPRYQEGELSKLKARLICEPTLAELARDNELGALLSLGRGEEASGGREKESLLADAWEAVIAAIYLDGGFEVTRTVVLALHEDTLDRCNSPSGGRDAKSRLQELVQQARGVHPRYRITAVDGPDHERQFTAQTFVGDEVLGVGAGRSKKDAQQAAAADALAALPATTHRGGTASEPPTPRRPTQTRVE